MDLSQEVALFLASHDHEWGHMWGAGAWWLWLVLKVALVAAVVFVITRWFRPRHRSGTYRAREILAERYARDELTADEYRKRLADLR